MTAKEFSKHPLIAIANHKRYLLLAFVGTFLIGAVGYYVFEGYTLIQTMEWSAQTITSTGYGNYPAQTPAGSLFSTFMMLWSVPLLLSLITAFFVSALRQDPNLFTDEEQEEILSFVRDFRAGKIQS